MKTRTLLFSNLVLVFLLLSFSAAQTNTLAITGVTLIEQDAEENHVAYASQSLKELWAGNQRASNATPEKIRTFRELSDAALQAVRDMHRAGVGILAGCDGLVPGFCLHDELILMVRGGLSPLAALQTATINPARYLGLERSLGSVQRGKSADLVLLDGNPLQEMGSLRRISAVVLDGKLLTRAELDAILERTKTDFR